MKRTKIPNGTLVLVCDGGKALFFENAGDERNLNLKTIETLSEPHPPTRQLGTDQPTRVFGGSSRSSVDEGDLHSELEVAFLRRVAKALSMLVRERRAPKVALIAAPRALGVLRTTIDAPTRAAVTLELDKDWVKQPVSVIESSLADLGTLR